MLIIIKTNRTFYRPKYRPTKQHDQWAVYDTTNKKSVLSNVTHAAAMQFINKNETSI